VVGTLPYMAPEIWRGEPYAFPADLYALGCTLFELAALLPPFDGPSALHLQRAVLKRRFQVELPGDEVYSQDLRDVVMRMIHPDPRERLTAE
jgi:serine/threonine protein kinase